MLYVYDWQVRVHRVGLCLEMNEVVNFKRTSEKQTHFDKVEENKNNGKPKIKFALFLNEYIYFSERRTNTINSFFLFSVNSSYFVLLT